jgi:hypothetical protein
LVVLATIALMLVSPSIATGLLMASSTRQQAATTSRHGSQFARLATAGEGALIGHLYIPIEGDYRFDQDRAYPVRMSLDGVMLLHPDAGRVMGIGNGLRVGFHRLELSGAGIPLGGLYWTTPGNAHYKELIPRLYLVGPGISWRDRSAIAIARWSWLLWVAGGTMVLFLALRQASCGTASQPDA